jgi:2'-5' RNA ligase
MDSQDQILILTLEMDSFSFEHFNSLRKKYFPPERNFVPAHITLFHHLPSSSISFQQIEQVCSRPPFEIEIREPWSLGNGVAFKVMSNDLMTLRDELRTQWQNHLTKQDLAPYKPHITIQNKVEAETARQLLKSLADVNPWRASATGLTLWEYQSGPWQFIQTFVFRQSSM